MTRRKTNLNPMCRAHKRATGEPCGNRALNGATVCRFHGGAAPQTREKAKERILAAADPAVGVIIDIMFNPRTPSAVRLAAARDLLDRAGLSARSVVEVDVAAVDPTLMAMVMEARQGVRADLRRKAITDGAELAGDGMDDVVEAELAGDDPDGGYVDLEFESVEV